MTSPGTSTGNFQIDSAQNLLYLQMGKKILRTNPNVLPLTYETLINSTVDIYFIKLDTTQGKIYWLQQNGPVNSNLLTIKRANLDGSNIENAGMLNGKMTSVGQVAIDLSAGRIYTDEAISGMSTIMLLRSDIINGNKMCLTCNPVPPTGSGGIHDIALTFKTVSVPVPGDVTGDGYVNIDDLLAVINAWGPCSSCPADLDNNGVVNIDDLLMVINNWTFSGIAGTQDSNYPDQEALNKANKLINERLSERDAKRALSAIAEKFE